MKIKFISKKKLLERIDSLERYVGAEYVTKAEVDCAYSEHQPNRERWSRNPIADLIIKAEEEK